MFLETRDQLAALQGSGQVFEIPTINASDITYDRESEKWLHKRIGRDTRNSATFTRFPDLPTEIRLNIWRFALRAPRTIMMILKMRKSKEENEQRDRDKEMQRLCIEHMGQSAVDSAKPPALLGVCRESREIALKVYSLCFIKTPKLSSESQNESGIFINNELDTIELLPQCHILPGHNHTPLNTCTEYSFSVSLQRYIPSSLSNIQNLGIQQGQLLFPGSKRTARAIELLTHFFPSFIRLDLKIYNKLRRLIPVSCGVEETAPIPFWHDPSTKWFESAETGLTVVVAKIPYWNVVYSVGRRDCSGLGVEISVVHGSAARRMAKILTTLDFAELMGVLS